MKYLVPEKYWAFNGGSLYFQRGMYGTATLDVVSGQFHYLLDNDDPDTEAMEDGSMYSDVFEVAVTDGALVAAQKVVFEIQGASDAVL